MPTPQDLYSIFAVLYKHSFKGSKLSCDKALIVDNQIFFKNLSLGLHKQVRLSVVGSREPNKSSFGELLNISYTSKRIKYVSIISRPPS